MLKDRRSGSVLDGGMKWVDQSLKAVSGLKLEVGAGLQLTKLLLRYL